MFLYLEEAICSRVSRLAKEMCIPDSVVGSESNPLGHRAVLLLRLGKLLLGTERLVALQYSSG